LVYTNKQETTSISIPKERYSLTICSNYLSCFC
jgi:hypothetical protein